MSFSRVIFYIRGKADVSAPTDQQCGTTRGTVWILGFGVNCPFKNKLPSFLLIPCVFLFVRSLHSGARC